VKANEGIKWFNAHKQTEAGCPNVSFKLERSYFGEIKDARQVVMFTKNERPYTWSGKHSKPRGNAEYPGRRMEELERHINRAL
jgi:hypothetical protein